MRKTRFNEAQMVGSHLWVHFEGRTFSVDLSEGTRGRKKAGAISSDQIKAPMPGKITKLFIKLGDSVVVGQPVLVMEAMKMEYTLKAECVGSVEALFCAVGEQVVLGKQLVKMKV